MGTTRKVLRKVAVIIEPTARTYQAPTTRIPQTSFTINAMFDMIEDESIDGQAYKALPNQGTKRVEGTLAGIVDVDTIDPILEAAHGAESSQVYSLPSTVNEKTLSIICVDGVKTYKYTGAVIKGITFTSEPNGRLVYSADVIAYTETRDDTAFPAMTYEKGTRIVHHHAGGTGFLRVGDQTNALAAGDNLGLSSLEWGWEWGFDHEFDNTSQTTLIPLSTICTPKFSFQISRHSLDTYLAFRDAGTALQASLYFYASSSATLLVEIPNFILPEAAVTEDDIAKIDIATMVGANGIGSSYSNSNMSFVTPIRTTLVNS